MSRQPKPLLLALFGLALWVAVATAHDMGAVVLRPLAPFFAWMFP